MRSTSRTPRIPPSADSDADGFPGTEHYTVTVAHDEQGLRDHLAAWQDLTHNLAEPNAFYEPWALLPALRQFQTRGIPHFVLVYLHTADQSEPLLCGFFPVQRRRLHRFLPIAVVESWRHVHCFLCTPLLRHGRAIPALEVFFDWLSQDASGAPLLRLDLVSGDGAFARTLSDVCCRRNRPTHTIESYSRALIVPRADPDAYIRAALKGRSIKGYRRKERSLRQRGHLERRELTPGDDASPWAEMFLQLEAKGWKGRRDTAMACHLADATFFRDMVQGASRAGSLMMSGLFLDGNPIALQCNLRSGTGSFAFKIAFDEDFASSSPGTLLELFNIELLHGDDGPAWMDSCAVAGHPVLDHLWTERRVITNQYVATGRWPGDLMTSAIPLARWLRQSIRSTTGS